MELGFGIVLLCGLKGGNSFSILGLFTVVKHWQDSLGFDFHRGKTYEGPKRPWPKSLGKELELALHFAAILPFQTSPLLLQCVWLVSSLLGTGRNMCTWASVCSLAGAIAWPS